MSKDQDAQSNLNSYVKLLADKLSLITPAEAVSFLLIGLALWLGAFGSFLLGVLFSLPTSVVRLIDETTITYLAGNVTFVFVVSAAFFKLTLPFVEGIGFICIDFFLYLRFFRRQVSVKGSAFKRYGKKLRRRLSTHNPEKAVVLAVRAGLTVLFVFFVFLGSDSEASVKESGMTPFTSMLWSFAVILTIAVAAYRRYRNHSSFGEFIASKRSREVVIVLCVFACFNFGFIRIHGFLQNKALILSGVKGSCEIIPIFPVFGGQLFFEKESESFVVLRSDGRSLYLPGKFDQLAIPNCLLPGQIRS